MRRSATSKWNRQSLLAINDFVDHRAVTITVTLRREKCQSRERRLNFERAAILTPEAKAQFESVLGPRLPRS